MKGRGFRVAILGASGRVGREFLKILAERNFPISELTLLASARSAGSSMEFAGKSHKIVEPTEKMFSEFDIVLASAGGSVSKQWAPVAVKAGCVFIDNSSAFRMDEGVPLVVPEVNGHTLKDHKGLIANPNCSTAQLVVVLKILHELAGLKRVIVSTYQSVSGAGKDAMDELELQMKAMMSSDEPYAPKVFKKQIACNLIPHIDSFADDGYTKEELKVVNESRKILELPNLPVTCTAVRVPVMIGHSESVTVDLERKVSPAQVRESLANSPIVEVWDQPEDGIYPTPVDCAGEDPVYVGRVRRDTSSENGINLWVVADNLRIGAALNAVRIAEYMVEHNLIGEKVTS